MYRYFFAILFFQISSLQATAQSSIRQLNDYMGSVVQNPYQAVPGELLADTRNEERLLSALEKYLTDSVEVVRSKAYYIVNRIGQKSVNGQVRMQAVTYMCRAVSDRSSIASSAWEALTGYRKDDFPKTAQDSILLYLRNDYPYVDIVAKIVGFLGIEGARINIRSIAESNLPFKFRWAAELALARMNDQEMINKIMGRLSRAVIDDNFVYQVAEDLVYTRQPQIFEVIESGIKSEALNCTSGDPDSNEKIICAYRLIELVAPVIAGFPFAIDESGSLLTDDYIQALTDVREWFDNNPTYQISRDKF